MFPKWQGKKRLLNSDTIVYVFTITNSAKNISEEAVHHWSLQTKLKYIANYTCLIDYVVDNTTTKRDLIG